VGVNDTTTHGGRQRQSKFRDKRSTAALLTRLCDEEAPASISSPTEPYEQTLYP